ncbi:unnamed protein product [Calypogeia fissa]
MGYLLALFISVFQNFVRALTGRLSKLSHSERPTIPVKYERELNTKEDPMVDGDVLTEAEDNAEGTAIAVINGMDSPKLMELHLRRI